jgi:type I restriction enzyme R subunit
MQVRDLIGGLLDAELPEEGYPKEVFLEKRDAVNQHLLNQATLGERYWV